MRRSVVTIETLAQPIMNIIIGERSLIQALTPLSFQLMKENLLSQW